MKNLLKRYWHYKDVLENMGNFPIGRDITIKDLKLSRGVIQSGYKEIEALGFKGTIIDYLCWIDAAHFFFDLIDDIDLAINLTEPDFLDLSESQNKKLALKIILRTKLELHPKQTNNIFRLWKRDASKLSELYDAILAKEHNDFFDKAIFFDELTNFYGKYLSAELKIDK